MGGSTLRLRRVRFGRFFVFELFGLLAFLLTLLLFARLRIGCLATCGEGDTDLLRLVRGGMVVPPTK
jgi:hypothetical protein